MDMSAEADDQSTTKNGNARDEDEGHSLADHKVDLKQVSTPMLEKVKKKLTAWSWREQQNCSSNDGCSRPPPLLEDDQEFLSIQLPRPAITPDSPPAPPNTDQTSARSSAWQSHVHTPAPDDDDKDNDRQASVSFRPGIHTIDANHIPRGYVDLPFRRRSLTTPAELDRRFSNLLPGDMHFQSHRDSVELLRLHRLMKAMEARQPKAVDHPAQVEQSDKQD